MSETTIDDGMDDAPAAAHVAEAFADPGALLDLRDRVRRGALFEVHPKRAA